MPRPVRLAKEVRAGKDNSSKKSLSKGEGNRYDKTTKEKREIKSVYKLASGGLN